MSNLHNEISTAKAWVKPELTRIAAGSAENGPPQAIPDGGGQGTQFNS